MKRKTIINILNGYESQLENEKLPSKIEWLNKQIHDTKEYLAKNATYEEND